MKIYWYIEDRSDLVIKSENPSGAYFTEMEVDDETGKRWLETFDAWETSAGEIFSRIK